MISSELVIPRSPPMVVLPMYGKAFTVAGGSASSARGSPWRISMPLRRFVVYIGASFSYLLKSGGVVVVLQRGRHMEKVEASERRSFHRRYKRPFAIRVRVHAERNFDEVRRERSERGSNWPGKSFLRSNRLTDNAIFPSYWMWHRVSTTSTRTIRYTET